MRRHNSRGRESCPKEEIRWLTTEGGGTKNARLRVRAERTERWWICQKVSKFLKIEPK
jgi:hypothetical protein